MLSLAFSYYIFIVTSVHKHMFLEFYKYKKTSNNLMLEVETFVLTYKLFKF